jgi:hypothetical protein
VHDRTAAGATTTTSPPLVALPKIDPLLFGRLYQNATHLVIQPPVRGESDRFLLHCPSGASRLRHRTSVEGSERKTVLKKLEPSEVLPLRILQKFLLHGLVALPIRALGVVKTYQKMDWKIGPADFLDVQRTEQLLEKFQSFLPARTKNGCRRLRM